MLNYSKYNFKVLVVGDGGVGKTSLTVRFTTGSFREDYLSTLGVNFYSKTVDVDGTLIKLTIWDTGGQERFKPLLPNYFKGGQGSLVVFDVTNPETFRSVEDWVEQVRRYCGDIPIILVGNKIDLLSERKVKHEEGVHLAEKLGAPYFESSAKTNEKVYDVFVFLASLIFKYSVKKGSELRSW
ncbi:MAG: GTP-binding protein [Candidatus Freyarchaeota archaeon]|nr:GTP-binding protein [Candidatus Jordarchaeia archaeon]